MILVHHPQCTAYGSPHHPERPARISRTAEHLRKQHPHWEWKTPAAADETDLRHVHTAEHLARLSLSADFDDDTPFYPGIDEHARRSAGAALAAMTTAIEQAGPAFSLMRPPGHHATADRAMGFCYLNSIAIAAAAARAHGVARVAIWDFDAHHGNGTEAIVRGQPGVLFASVHQSPGYPGTGTHSVDNCHNFPVEPHATRTVHREALQRSWSTVLAFKPELMLVSAGFDAYARDPLTEMSLEAEDFHELGSWLRQAGVPAAAILEGGYSPDLPSLIDSFLTGWAE